MARENVNIKKKLSLEERSAVIALHKTKKGYKSIANILKMPVTSVRAIVKKWKKTGSVADAPRSGRPRETSAHSNRLLVKSVKINPKVKIIEKNVFFRNQFVGMYMKLRLETVNYPSVLPSADYEKLDYLTILVLKNNSSQN